MDRDTLRWPMIVQIAAVVALFLGALATLWHAGASVVGREERRALANAELIGASDLLAREGANVLAAVRPYPEYTGPREWATIADRLGAAAADVRGRFADVECGYYIPGKLGLTQSPTATAAAGATLDDAVETQADAAYRKGHESLAVQDVPPDTVAIHTMPIAVGREVVGATWALIRLADPVFLDRAPPAYRLFVALALAGIAASSALTFRLVATIRRQGAEREQLQRRLRRRERLAAMGQLLAGVAHEVRNPLAGIRSTVQLWQRGIAIEGVSLAGLVDEVDRIEGIVANLLQFSRDETRAPSSSRLNDVLAEAARLASPPATAAGIAIEVDLDRAAPPVAMAAPALLQIVRNLTTNALQAMPEGGAVRLRSRVDPAGGYVEAIVEDDGLGLSAEAHEHLFEPFFTTKPAGTGLGLALAREIALRHGGDLHGEDRPDGPGARFTLTLPAAVPAGPEEPRDD